jgi:putative nucleotidyltransferase with HDIG domain
MKHSVPPEVLSVVQRLHDAGYEAYLVGGCVRDMIRGVAPKDWDATANATPEQIIEVFGVDETFYENNFGTVGVKSGSDNNTTAIIEVTPYRTEGEYHDARRPSSVQWASHIQDDLARRDFTINAIAYNPITNELVDPYGGQDDLHRGVLQTVGDAHERFAEDALRILRALRLSCELGFAIDGTTLLAISTQKDALAKISRERVRDELLRVIMSPSPLLGFSLMHKLGLLPYTIPELAEGVGCEQNQAHSFDVFEHLLRSLQHAADKQWPLHVRTAALLHDIGKPASRRFDAGKNDYTFHGHEVIGARMSKKILTDLRFPTDIAETVVALVRWHMFFADPDQITLSAVRRIVRNVGTEHIHDLLHLRMCDRIGTGRPKEQPFRLRKYMSMVDEAMRDPISVTQLKVDGAAVMQHTNEKPGPRIGWMLHALLEEVLDDPTKNTAEYLQQRALQLHELSDVELKALGMAGKDRREEEEEKEIAQLRKKHHVN